MYGSLKKNNGEEYNNKVKENIMKKYSSKIKARLARENAKGSVSGLKKENLIKFVNDTLKFRNEKSVKSNLTNESSIKNKSNSVTPELRSKKHDLTSEKKSSKSFFNKPSPKIISRQQNFTSGKVKIERNINSENKDKLNSILNRFYELKEKENINSSSLNLYPSVNMNKALGKGYSKVQKESIFSAMPDNLKNVLLSIYSIICDNASKSSGPSREVQEHINSITAVSNGYMLELKNIKEKLSHTETELTELKSKKESNNLEFRQKIDELNSYSNYLTEIIRTVKHMLNDGSITNLQDIKDLFNEYQFQNDKIIFENP